MTTSSSTNKPSTSSCCTYPRTFLETLGPTATTCQEMLSSIKKLDQEAVKLREEYMRDEDEFVEQAVEMLINKNTTVDELQAWLADENRVTELASRRQAVDELRVQTQKAAVEAYDSLDTTIQRLDNDIARLEPQITLSTIQLAAQKTAMRRKSTKKADKDRKSGVGAEAALGDGSKPPDDVPIDPNEPVYCICQRVSFGQMVGCDNDDCRFEWFHYECVNLKEQPQGKWYCPDCTQRMSEEG